MDILFDNYWIAPILLFVFVFILPHLLLTKKWNKSGRIQVFGAVLFTVLNLIVAFIYLFWLPQLAHIVGRLVEVFVLGQS